SEQSALQMAQGACRALEVDVAVSVTGIAGPDGGTAQKPVGTVWLAIAQSGKARAQLHHFAGGREQIRQASVHAALTLLLETL
ncbi:MAG: CinA family protein, partial [Coriobacteriales bacterium]|nr:CinA family protein [Coriobacteriales bacterium]